MKKFIYNLIRENPASTGCFLGTSFFIISNLIIFNFAKPFDVVLFVLFALLGSCFIFIVYLFYDFHLWQAKHGDASDKFLEHYYDMRVNEIKRKQVKK